MLKAFKTNKSKVEFDTRHRRDRFGFCEEYCLVIKYIDPVSLQLEEVEIWQRDRQGYNSFMLEMNEKIKDKDCIREIIQNDINKKRYVKELDVSKKEIEKRINDTRYFIEL